MRQDTARGPHGVSRLFPAFRVFHKSMQSISTCSTDKATGKENLNVTQNIGEAVSLVAFGGSGGASHTRFKLKEGAAKKAPAALKG